MFLVYRYCQAEGERLKAEGRVQGSKFKVELRLSVKRKALSVKLRALRGE